MMRASPLFAAGGPDDPAALRLRLVEMARAGRGSAAQRRAAALLDAHGDAARLRLVAEDPHDARTDALLEAAGLLPIDGGRE